MAKISAQHLAFNRGEVSKIALARIDVAKLALAAECQLNWMPFVLGAMMLRPGLAYVGEIAGDAPCELVDFFYAKADTALVELTDSVMRVWIEDALLTRASVATVVLDPNMSGTGGHWATTGTTAGCTATVTGGVATLTASARGGLSRISQTLTVPFGSQNVEHGLRLTITNGPVTLRAGSLAGSSDVIARTVLDTGTHSIPFTLALAGAVVLQLESTDARAKTLTQVTLDPAGALSLPTPWTASALPSLRWAQSGDIIYVAQYGGPQYKIERRGVRPGARGWSVELYKSDNGPFLEGASIAANLTPSVYYGNGTLACDQAFFTTGHLGALFRLFSPGQANLAVLGAGAAFTEAIRVTGVGADRVFSWIVAGTFVGTLSLQRSLVGPDSSFAVVATQTAAGTFSNDDSATLNNVIAWYRVGFAVAADYTSGAATVHFGGAAAGAGGRYGICRVTQVPNSVTVSIEVIEDFSTLTPTADWQEQAWSNAQGWPSSVLFHENRLCWLGVPALPMICSQSNFYAGYAEEDNLGESLGDSGAILEAFGDGPSDAVNWGLSLSPRMLAGREGSISSIRSSSFDTPLTPDDFAAKDCSQQGAARLAALKVGKRGVFVQAAGNKVYELFFNPQVADFDDRDLTRFNPDIGAPGFVDSAKSTQPDTYIWLPRGDGMAAALLYDPNDEVEAWWRVMTLGVIENVRVLPRAAGGDDQVYMVVKRTVNGTPRRFLEKLTQRAENAGGLINRALDCHVAVTIDGDPVNTVTVAHLPNTAVTVWADGKARGTFVSDGGGVVTLPGGYNAIVAGLTGGTVTFQNDTPTGTMTGLDAYDGIPGEFFADQQPSGRLVRVGTLTPAGGSVTLPNGMQSSNIVAFFGYVAPFMSAKLGASMPGGGARLTQTVQLEHVGLVMADTHAQGLQLGQSFDNLDALPLMIEGAAVDANAIWQEYDEPSVSVPGTWDTDARLCLLARAPYPVKVCGVVIG